MKRMQSCGDSPRRNNKDASLANRRLLPPKAAPTLAVKERRRTVSTSERVGRQCHRIAFFRADQGWEESQQEDLRSRNITRICDLGIDYLFTRRRFRDGFLAGMSLYPSSSASASKAKRRSVATRGPEQLSDEQRQEVKEAFELFDGDKVRFLLFSGWIQGLRAAS
jgi:hypothetical protein